MKTAINRAYYACFHAARAVLWSESHAPKTHKGAKKQFHQSVVNAGLVDKRFGEILERTASERNLADYHAMSDSFDRDEVAELVAQARAFVERMQQLLNG